MLAYVSAMWYNIIAVYGRISQLKAYMSIIVSDKMSPRKTYTCSDGKTYFNSRHAYIHEMYVRIPSLFPQNAMGLSRTYRGGEYYISKHDYIKCGIYHIVLKDEDDLTVLNHFFRGIKDELDYPEEDDFPIELDLDIYHEVIPGTIMDRAQWRLYDEENYSS